MSLHYYHLSHRGDTLFLTDAGGNAAARFTYDAFGRLLSSADAHVAAYGFSGKEWDAEAGLYYFGFRWYDPNTGTWTTKDLLGFGAGDINVLRYVGNAPLVLVDCYGLLLWGTVGSVAGKIWSAPNTIIGVTIGTVGVAFGGDLPTFSNNAIEFANNPIILENAAITLGNAINYSPGFPPWAEGMDGNVACDHERQHTYQGELLGPFYIPANIVGGMLGLTFDGNWHGSSNFMESGPKSHPPTP